MRWVLIFIALEGAIIFSIHSGWQEKEQKHLGDHRLNFQTAYNSIINSYSLVAETLYSDLINKPAITQAFYDGFRSEGHEREIAQGELFRLLYPTYLQLKARNLRHLHFHLPDGTSFLHFHRTDKYDHKLFANHPSERIRNADRKPAQGFETGTFAQGFRYVIPMFHQQQHIGSFELSVSFKAIREELTKLAPSRDYALVLKKDAIFPHLLPSERSLYVESKLHAGYVYEDLDAKLPDRPSPRNAVIDSIDRSLRGTHGVLSGMQQAKPFALAASLNGTDYAVSFIPVLDAQSKQVGYMISYEPNSFSVALSHDYYGQLSMATLLLTLALFFIRHRHTSGNAIRYKQEQLQAITDTMKEGILATDAYGRISFVNPATEMILGYSRDELIGRRAQPLFHLEFSEQPYLGNADSVIANTLLTGRAYHSEDQRFVTKSGDLVPVEVCCAPLRAKGHLISSVTVFRDITERLNDQAALRKNEARLRKAHKVAHIGNWEYSRTKGEMRWSQELYLIFGIGKDAPITFASLMQCIHADDRYQIKRTLARTLQEGVAQDRDFRIVRTDGEERWIHGLVELSRGEDGEPISVFGVFQDITERKRSEAQVREALLEKLEAQAANRAKSQFLANMSHELRTPLNAIIGYSEMLHEDAEMEGQVQQAEDLQKIQGAGKHLLGLINDVLDISKIEAGRMELHLERFSVRPLLDEVIETLKPAIAKQGIELVLQCPSEPGAMHADLTKVRQVLFNLLSNAIKFTAQGSVGVEVCREKYRDGHGFLFRVTDTGIGMSPAQINRLFQPFSQADASTTRKYGGTGLGLAISQRFCEMMGGSIEIVSQVGEGSCFSVRLPAKVVTQGESGDRQASYEEIVQLAEIRQ